MTVATPERAERTVEFLETAPDHGIRYRDSFQRLADELDRDVIVAVPHQGGRTSASTLARHLDRGPDRDPFVLTLFNIPAVMLPEGDEYFEVRLGTDGRRMDPVGLHTVLMQAHIYLSRGFPTLDAATTALSDALFDFGDEAGTSYRGEFSMDWLLDMIDRPPRSFMGARSMPVTGYLYDDAAFIPHDLVHTESAHPFIERLVDELSEVYSDLSSSDLTPEQRAELRAERAAERERRAKEARITRSVSNVEEWSESITHNNVVQAEQELRTASDYTENAKAEFVRAARRLDDATMRVELARRMVNKASPDQLQSVERMLRKGVLKSIEGAGTTLTFTTGTIYAQDERTEAWHEIGSIRASVDMRTGGMQFTNLDRQIRGFSERNAAPHVMSSGSPCMGSFAETVGHLVAEQDWLLLIEMTIAFLQSANTSDVAGWYVHRWPFVERPEEHGLPPYPHAVAPFAEPVEHDEDEDDDEDEED